MTLKEFKLYLGLVNYKGNIYTFLEGTRNINTILKSFPTLLVLDTYNTDTSSYMKASSIHAKITTILLKQGYSFIPNNRMLWNVEYNIVKKAVEDVLGISSELNIEKLWKVLL